MDKRLPLVAALIIVVLFGVPLLFPHPPVPPRLLRSDSSAVAPDAPIARTVPVAPAPVAARVSAPPSVKADTIVDQTLVTTTWFSSIGAAPLAIQVDSFASLNGKGGQVVLKHGQEPLLRFRVITPADTIALDRMSYTSTKTAGTDGGSIITFTGSNGKEQATIRYNFVKDNYLSTISFDITGAASPAFLLVDLPGGFDTQEADSVGDMRALAYSVKPINSSARGTAFTKLDSGEKKLESGPLSWVVAKSKYFLVGLLEPVGGVPFAEAHLEGGARTRKQATNASATAVMPLVNGHATFEMYAGPQSWKRLHAIGREFETANPYGGWLQPVVQPFSTIVMATLLWMKKTLPLSYGWVLVIFGIAVRLLMWPLNQGAMRTSIKMQRIQPELTEVQKKYKSNPQKQQEEIMRVYKEHNMSPFSTFSGCLPMLIPMPVFFALFFVFQNTIEFRNVPFLWMHDISLHDPYYILPILMGLSMLLVSWIGMRGAPPNPQAKMMMYLMPGMFVLLLFNTAAGLSIYYLTQNIASLPQQWLIANERAKAKQTG
ncbi:MAG TPA: YidC/Oxa1 family insertase periplasmic-domain containing protein [Gemmatimonadaceae bacterium]|jgi:YidC/Oxa1 family membrane protein insertase